MGLDVYASKKEKKELTEICYFGSHRPLKEYLRKHILKKDIYFGENHILTQSQLKKIIKFLLLDPYINSDVIDLVKCYFDKQENKNIQIIISFY